MKTSLPVKKLCICFSISIVIKTVVLTHNLREMVFKTLFWNLEHLELTALHTDLVTSLAAFDAVITITAALMHLLFSAIWIRQALLVTIKRFSRVRNSWYRLPANTTWWMDFNMSLYQAGTMIPVMPMQFYATGVGY
jgi:hypothetical protein